jgi:hypothetical protein
MRGPFGPMSCTYMHMHTRVRAYVCVRAHVCVRACLCACVCMCVRIRVSKRCVCACVYSCVHTCVHALCTCACVRMCERVSVRIRVYVRVCVYICPIHVCVWVQVRLHACACEGIEDALPLGVFSPQERASLPTLGALRGGLGGFPGLSPFMLRFN